MGPKVEELYWCVVNIPSGDISKGDHFSFFPLESHKMNFVGQDIYFSLFTSESQSKAHTPS